MIFTVVMASCVIFILVISSISDIQKREVADLLSWGLVFIGLILRILFSFSYGKEMIISGLIGLGICFVISLILYYTGQWGGADSKLLMGMGSVIGVDFLFNSLQSNAHLLIYGMDLLIFVVLLLLAGSIYSLIWSVGLAIKNYNAFFQEFRLLFFDSKGYFYTSLVVFVLSILIGIKSHWLFFSFGLLVIFSYFLFVGILAVERSGFVVQKDIIDLVPGDWLMEKVRGKRGDTIYSKTLEKGDLEKLLKWYSQGIIKKVKIKEGIPFVPAFLFAYILLLTQSKWLVILQSFL
jgi:Flp pilus assembly protein protease CpaA